MKTPITPITPLTHFKTAIAEKLIADGLFSVDFFKSQQKRIEMFWIKCESVEGIYDIIQAFAEGQAKNFSYPTRQSMEAVGCVYTRVDM